MSALKFGKLPPGVSSWKSLYTPETNEDGTPVKRYFRVKGSTTVTTVEHINEIVEVDDGDDTDDDTLIELALTQAMIGDVDDTDLDIIEVDADGDPI